MKMKKSLSMLLAASLLATCAMSACNSFIDTGEEIDPNKTQLKVFNFNGGIGSFWVEEAARRFAEKYENYEFEPGTGKKGVQFLWTKEKWSGAVLEDKIKNFPDDVYFGDRMFYAKWAQDGLLLDISNMVQETLDEYGETDVTIEDKLDQDTISALTCIDGKYYGLPHYEGFRAINYNVNLFESELFYFNDDGDFVSTLQEKRSAGPNGIYENNTGDDGLPASLEQFKELCEYMVSTSDVKPFVWTGEKNEYFTMLLDVLSTALLGKEQSELFYNFNGPSGQVQSEIITSFEEDGTPNVDTVTIRENTGYYLWQLSALYYASDFASAVIESGETGNPWYAGGSISKTYSHEDAQEDFIRGQMENAPIAMLIDGNYWENEAKMAGKIEQAEKDFTAYDHDEVRYAMMPLPGVVAGDTGSARTTLKDYLQSYGFINGKLKDDPNKANLAKMFLQFCYTDVSLREFTTMTGMTRNVSYTLSPSEYNSLSNYAKSVWDLTHSNANVDRVKTTSTSKVFINNESEIINDFWRSQPDGKASWDRPYLAFYNGRLSAQDYFMGLRELHKASVWEANNRQYYEWFD